MDSIIYQYLVNDCLVLIPVIYIIGMILKGLSVIPDKYIPVILLFVAWVCTVFIIGFNVRAFIQAVLVTGVSVYFNQVIKQINKSDDNK